LVEGIELFEKAFKGLEDCYTIIGGAACDILMSEADVDFRLTKDIDLILILEEKRVEFAKAFWNFIKEGRYKCGWKSSDEMHFYRFTEPNKGYPLMIEIFSRNPGYNLGIAEGIIPIHIDDNTSSLSAILLNDDFYDFMMKGRRIVSGISVLSAAYIIPFKMYAWLNLKQRKLSGEHVNERDYKKHKNDVFRLLQIINFEEKISVKGMVKDSVVNFLEDINNEPINIHQLGLTITKEEALNMLFDIYLN